MIAYRTPADEMPMVSLHPKVTTSAGPIDGAALMDDSLNTAVTIALRQRVRRWRRRSALGKRHARKSKHSSGSEDIHS